MLFSFFVLFSSVSAMSEWSGLVNIPNASIFTRFVPCDSNPLSCPLLLWLQGGPGCSHAMGYYYEVGPESLMNGGPSPISSNTSWTQFASLIFVDSPAGTGFSQGEIPTTAEGVAAGVVAVLDALLGSGGRLSSLAGQNFYVAGESYSGRIIPLVAKTLLTRSSSSMKFSSSTLFLPKLGGIAIGDGLLDPEVQVNAHADFMAATGLINPAQKALALKAQEAIVSAIRKGEIAHAGDLYNNYTLGLMESSGMPDPSDIRHYGFARLEVFQTAVDYLNLASTRARLGVGNRNFSEICASAVGNALAGDELSPLDPSLFPQLLAKTRVLLYNGNFDFTIPPASIELFIESIQWTGRSGFAKAPRTILQSKDQSKVFGYIQNYQTLSHFVVVKAGHMAPMDQPEAMFAFMQKWVV